MRVFFLLLFFSSFLLVRAQDPIFSQTYMQLMYLNPALTGELKGWQLNSHYRNQWHKIDAYQTTALGVQKQLSKYNAGVGVSVLNDQAGDRALNTTHAGLNAAKRFGKQDTFEIALGLKIDFGQKSVDYSKLTFGDQIDNRYGFTLDSTNFNPHQNNVSYMNLTVGIDLNIFRGNVGFSCANINEPNDGIVNKLSSSVPRRFTTYLSYPLVVHQTIKFYPLLVYAIQDDFNSILYGISSQYKFVNSFVGYRNQDSFIGGIGVNLDRLKVQYSYDLTTSTLSNQTGGSHELGVVFRFGSKEGYDDRNFVF